MNLKVVESALREVHYTLRSKHQVYFNLKTLNRFNHTLFIPPITREDVPRYYTVFKKDFFTTFYKKFPLLKGFKSIGESINVDYLKNAIDLNVDWILFVYDSGEIYRVSPKVIMKFCVDNDLIRTQDKLNSFQNGIGKDIIRETTYSFPIDLLERFN